MSFPNGKRDVTVMRRALQLPRSVPLPRRTQAKK
jgi:hypothetical protein